MKPAAMLATLLLHAAAIGISLYVVSFQSETQTSFKSVEITLLPASPLALAATPAAENPAPIAKTQVRQDAAARPEPASKASHTVAKGKEISPEQTLGATSAAMASSAFNGASTGTAKTSVSIPAAYAASNRKPQYPMLSRRQEEQGTVLLRIFVKADGSAGDVLVKKSSGHQLLDESALYAVRDWRFHPATHNNKPIAEWYQLAIPFTLHN